MIRHFRCEGCGHIHHELPDFRLPYKQHITVTFEKIYSGDRWNVCCDDNEFRRLYLWLVRIFLPMAAELFSPLPGTGASCSEKRSQSPLRGGFPGSFAGW